MDQTVVVPSPFTGHIFDRNGVIGVSRNNTIAAASAALLVLIIAIVVVVLVTQRSSSTTTSPTINPETTLPSAIRDDTHILDAAEDDTVTVVEFLDFECEACGAFYPYVEELRSEYAGRVTFAFRYFPLPNHGNSMNAAVAVEAASRQDALEAMYARLFETQAEWGEKGSESQAWLFREFAVELGLDMEQYDADVADPLVEIRVKSDFEEGIELGVDRTPTFFVNDRRIAIESFDDLRTAIDAELAP